MTALAALAKDRSLTAGHFTALGACSDVTLGSFDWEQKSCENIPLNEQVEMLSSKGTWP
jgi:predicted DNA-binding protein with PD1-like motif